jgi:hypothetical protein
MAIVDRSRGRAEDPGVLLDEWMGHLTQLVDAVEGWVRELDWSTRRIEKKMEDSVLGSYEAPVLLMQRETTRVLLEPIARFVPGADGVVDLYWMPAYDDIASLYLVEGRWRLHYVYPDTGAIDKGANAIPLTKETLSKVLDDMCSHVA